MKYSKLKPSSQFWIAFISVGYLYSTISYALFRYNNYVDFWDIKHESYCLIHQCLCGNEDLEINLELMVIGDVLLLGPLALGVAIVLLNIVYACISLFNEVLDSGQPKEDK